ncbi:MAG: glycosyltransferase family 1 protein [Betaproteobacteria bacterium]|nr:MAG: glycosyltransferase family 1 protein [Betaproteobacteria bacterium]
MHIVHSESSCGWGGQEIRMLEEAAGMLARGHRVTLLCPPEARIYEEAARSGVPAVALPIARKGLAGLRALRAWLANVRCDVLNSHSSTDSWLAALALLGMNPRPALVRTRHISAAIPDNIATRWLYQSATRRIVTTGERLREQLIRDNRFRAETIVSVPTGIDLARFAPADRAQAKLRLGLDPAQACVGIVATLRSWKGHRYLVEAFASLKQKDARLLLVGNGPGWDNLKQQVAQLGLVARVLMPGNQADVVPWLQALDVFALPSYANEGVPQALMQAMAVGVPVVSTSVGSIDELVRHEETGLMVPPRDADALRAAIERLLGEPALGERLAQAARAWVSSRYSRERMLDRMEAVFRSVAA